MTDVWRSHVGIPVRNLWFLLAYASGLARFLDPVDAAVDDDAELPDILARLLAWVVERRLRRGLSRGYRPRDAVLTRVRGRIDWLPTETGMLLQRGRIACRFEELTHDTPRNRLARAALEAMRARCRNREAAAACGRLALELGRAGVRAGRPSRAEMSRDRIGRHDIEDRVMVTVAELALDLVLPAEAAGDTRLSRLDREESLPRRIFEGGVASLYAQELHGVDGWRVRSQADVHWQRESETAGLAALLPQMKADIILRHGDARLIVVDTKFTGVVVRQQYGDLRFKSQHLYQLYAYVRSLPAEGTAAAEGILLYPALGQGVDEAVVIQGHVFRFVTVNLGAPCATLRADLLDVVRRPSPLAQQGGSRADTPK